MQGGRGRKRRGAQQETLQTQDYSLRSKCPTRRSSTPQLLPISPPGSIPHTPCLRPALRIIREDSRAAANAMEGDTLYDISVKEEVKTFSLPNASDSSTRHKMDQEGPCALLTSLLEVPQHDVDGHISSVKPHVLEKCKTHDRPSSTRCLSHSPSLNLTEMARALLEEDDLDEVESSPYECVHGHKVKLEIAPLVRAIFDKYGVITAESDVKSPSIIASHILEHLCIVYQKLKQGKFFDIARGEINDMLEELRFYEKQKVKVGWLLERVQQIFEAKKRTEEYLLVKGEVAKCSNEMKSIEQEIEHNRRHIALIQKKISAAEQQKEAKEAEKNEHTKKALDIKAQVQAITAQSLVHGLL